MTKVMTVEDLRKVLEKLDGNLKLQMLIDEGLRVKKMPVEDFLVTSGTLKFIYEEHKL